MRRLRTYIVRKEIVYGADGFPRGYFKYTSDMHIAGENYALSIRDDMVGIAMPHVVMLHDTDTFDIEFKGRLCYCAIPNEKYFYIKEYATYYDGPSVVFVATYGNFNGANDSKFLYLDSPGKFLYEMFKHFRDI